MPRHELTTQQRKKIAQNMKLTAVVLSGALIGFYYGGHYFLSLEFLQSMAAALHQGLSVPRAIAAFASLGMGMVGTFAVAGTGAMMSGVVSIAMEEAPGFVSNYIFKPALVLTIATLEGSRDLAYYGWGKLKGWFGPRRPSPEIEVEEEEDALEPEGKNALEQESSPTFTPQLRHRHKATETDRFGVETDHTTISTQLGTTATSEKFKIR